MGHNDAELLDVQQLARRIKAARALAGFKSVNEVLERMAALGVEVSRRSYYAWENAEWPPPIDSFVALMVVLNPPGGLLWFESAIRPDVAQAWHTMAEADSAQEARHGGST